MTSWLVTAHVKPSDRASLAPSAIRCTGFSDHVPLRLAWNRKASFALKPPTTAYRSVLDTQYPNLPS
eukprot:1446382-Rhodomonas_salina.1